MLASNTGQRIYLKQKRKKKSLEVENNIRTAAKVAAAAVAVTVAVETNANSILHKRISVAPYVRSTEHDCVCSSR